MASPIAGEAESREARCLVYPREAQSFRTTRRNDISPLLAITETPNSPAATAGARDPEKCRSTRQGSRRLDLRARVLRAGPDRAGRYRPRRIDSRRSGEGARSRSGSLRADRPSDRGRTKAALDCSKPARRERRLGSGRAELSSRGTLTRGGARFADASARCSGSNRPDSPTLLVRSRRRPQHFQRSTPSHIPPHAPDPPNGSFQHLASRHCGLKSESGFPIFVRPNSVRVTAPTVGMLTGKATVRTMTNSALSSIYDRCKAGFEAAIPPLSSARQRPASEAPTDAPSKSLFAGLGG